MMGRRLVTGASLRLKFGRRAVLLAAAWDKMAHVIMRVEALDWLAGLFMVAAYG